MWRVFIISFFIFYVDGSRVQSWVWEHPEIFPSIPIAAPDSKNEQCRNDSLMLIDGLSQNFEWAVRSKFFRIENNSSNFFLSVGCNTSSPRRNPNGFPFSIRQLRQLLTSDNPNQSPILRGCLFHPRFQGFKRLSNFLPRFTSKSKNTQIFL